MRSAYAGFWVCSFQFSYPECHLSCTPITHSNLVCIYHADSEHDIVKSRVLLNWGNINFDFVWQWNWKKITVETNHLVREATHHFKVIVFQGYSNMSKITDGSHHATINPRPGRLVGKQGRLEPVSGTHARGGRTLRRAGCAGGSVCGGLTR
ncbi:unnamed protein product [Musa hybrid cultivar]